MSKYKIDYYKVLEIDNTADLETIRNAYRNLAKKYHPDTCQLLEKKEAEEKFKLINEAYDILSDSSKREKYDLANMPKEVRQSKGDSNIGKRQSSANWSASDYHYEAFGGGPTNKYYTPDKAKQRMEKILVVSKISAAFLLVFLFLGFGLFADRIYKAGKQSKEVNQNTKITDYSKNKYFTLGSNKQRVIEVMGNPDQDNGYAYEYGNSSVYYNKNEKVSGWNNINNELKVFLANPVNQASPIIIGSTKSDVMKAMGTPTFLNKNIWRYGKSYIFFDSQGKVKAWKNLGSNLRVSN